MCIYIFIGSGDGSGVIGDIGDDINADGGVGGIEIDIDNGIGRIW